jgi:hypothetical protein
MDESKAASKLVFAKYEQNMEAHIKQIGLDPAACRSSIRLKENKTNLLSYVYSMPSGGSFISYAYEATDRGEMRAYIFAEIGIVRFSNFIHEELYLILSKTNCSIPHALKVCLTQDRVLTIGFRLPADALTDEYLSELLNLLDHYSKGVLNDVNEYFASPNAAIALATKKSDLI